MDGYITPAELTELSGVSIADDKEATKLIKEASVAIDALVMPNIIDPIDVPDEIKQATAWQCEHTQKYGGLQGLGLFSLDDLTIGGQSENANNMIPNTPDRVVNLLLSKGWLYAGVGGY